MTVRVIGSWRPFRTVWAIIGAMYWLLAVLICLGLATQVLWWASPLFTAAAGAAAQPLIWWVIGSTRMRMSLDARRFLARGWLWRDDIVIARHHIDTVRVTQFFDPRLHSLLWIRGMRTYPVKLEFLLRSGDVVSVPSSFAPRRISQRQADQINRWIADTPPSSSRTSTEPDPYAPGYVVDTMPRWVEQLPWDTIALALGSVALLLTIVLAASGAPEALHWWPALVAFAAGGVAAFGRLVRRHARSKPDTTVDHVF